MRKDLGNKITFLPQPVLIIGTYDEKGVANAMNAAWGGQYDYNQIFISLSKHKTTDNLEINKEFTVSFATKNTLEISDYFGVVSGKKENKIEKAKVHVKKSEHINAPIIEEYPLTLECKVHSFDDGILVGDVINMSVDEDYLKEDGTLDVDKMEIISFDPSSNTYRVLGVIVGNAFKDGLNIK